MILNEISTPALDQMTSSSGMRRAREPDRCENLDVLANLNFEAAAVPGRPWPVSRSGRQSCQAARPVRAAGSSSFVRSRKVAHCIDDVRPGARPIGEPRPAGGLPRANPSLVARFSQHSSFARIFFLQRDRSILSSIRDGRDEISVPM
jgi:hypothetical protein